MLMTQIISSDIIYATVLQRGRTLISVKLSGMTTLNEIINHLKNLIKDIIGLVTLQLRNSTQGWNQNKNIMICSKP